MILLFQLTMPGVGSWNGQWSGASRFFGKVKNVGRSKQAEEKGREILESSPYRYNWDDGWAASIEVSQVDAKEAARLRRVIRKANEGFCGYDWMVNSLLHYGDIRIMPHVMCKRCRRAEVDNNWAVVGEALLKYVDGYTLCPECEATKGEDER